MCSPAFNSPRNEQHALSMVQEMLRAADVENILVPLCLMMMMIKMSVWQFSTDVDNDVGFSCFLKKLFQ